MWRQLPRDLKILLASTILANIGGRMTRPFMPLYILALGGSVAQVGVFFTVNTLSAALLRPLGGWFSDAVGRIQAVAIGTVFSLAGTIGYALAPTWTWLLVAAIVMAFGRALVGPSFHAFTAESAPKGYAAQTFGLVNGLFNVCQVIGPLLGGWIIDHYALRAIFWVSAAFMGVASVLRILPAVGRAFRWRQVRLARLQAGFRGLFAGLVGGGLLTWLFVTDSVRDLGVNLYDNLQSVLVEQNGFDEAQIGLLFSMHAVVYLLVSLFGSRLADRWSMVGALSLSGLVHATGLAVLAQWTTPSVFWLYFAMTGIGLGLGDPAFDAFLARSTPRERLGLTFGMFQTAISILATPAPYLGSLLWESVSPISPFWGGAALMLVAGVLTWMTLRPLERDNL
jgi:MFS family permease